MEMWTAEQVTLQDGEKGKEIFNEEEKFVLYFAGSD